MLLPAGNHPKIESKGHQTNTDTKDKLGGTNSKYMCHYITGFDGCKKISLSQANCCRHNNLVILLA